MLNHAESSIGTSYPQDNNVFFSDVWRASSSNGKVSFFNDFSIGRAEI